jgi:hypothetical protein
VKGLTTLAVHLIEDQLYIENLSISYFYFDFKTKSFLFKYFKILFFVIRFNLDLNYALNNMDTILKTKFSNFSFKKENLKK